MRNIYVVAHPEAVHHVAGLVGGWFDSDLTERGVRQAGAIATALEARLHGESVEIHSSDLRRAQRTAGLIGTALGVSPAVDPDLREKSYGEAEGKPTAWLKELSIPVPECGERLRHNEGIAGAETRMDLAERAYRAMDRITARAAGNQIIVSHGGTITLLIAAWLGIPIESSGLAHFRATSGSISLLRKNPCNFSHELLELIDVSHLAGI